MLATRWNGKWLSATLSAWAYQNATPVRIKAGAIPYASSREWFLQVATECNLLGNAGRDRKGEEESDNRCEAVGAEIDRDLRRFDGKDAR